ncbi:COG1361 family protein [Saccharopolyspora pogona]|uniref:hypothetical protein n=1 Tax=Saccharopolyspora pogona TaxID=333966 RepID=UPI001682E9FE|nr:hypothetical protein [Saccharopolyspora pogona]
MPTYRGSWRLRVIGNDAMYPQRVVIDGSVADVIPGKVGQEKLISGKEWHLRLEYHDGSRWKRSTKVLPQQVRRNGNQAAQIIVSKDTFKFDSAPNDLVLSLEKVAESPNEQFSIENLFASDSINLTKLGGDALNRAHGEHLLGVEIKNTGVEEFSYDALLEFSSQGRARLAEHEVLVQDEWSPAVLRSTGQEVFDGAVSVPPLDVGETTTVYFQVDSTLARPGDPSIEFELRQESDGQTVTSRSTAAITVQGGAPARRPDGRAKAGRRTATTPTRTLPRAATSFVHEHPGATANGQ